MLDERNISFTVAIAAVQCNYWDEHEEIWADKGCVVSDSEKKCKKLEGIRCVALSPALSTAPVEASLPTLSHTLLIIGNSHTLTN